jgi:excisionase family DNA binding protein
MDDPVLRRNRSEREPHAAHAEAVNSAILTKQQAAEYLQVTRYIERIVRLGRLRALKPSGKLWRVRRNDLDARGNDRRCGMTAPKFTVNDCDSDTFGTEELCTYSFLGKAGEILPLLMRQVWGAEEKLRN